MSLLSEMLRRGGVETAHRPWPRAMIDAGTWRTATDALANGTVTLVSLWADGATVHMALSEVDRFAVHQNSVEIKEDGFET